MSRSPSAPDAPDAIGPQTSGPRTHRWLGAGVLVALMLVATGCGTGTSGDPAEVADVEAISDEISEQLAEYPPSLAESEFCRRLLDLDAQDDLTTERLAAEYRELLAIVPNEIAVEFQAVIGDLDQDPVSTTGDDELPSQPADADLTAVEALAAYVDRVCRATTSNPLPPPTTPGNDDPANR